MKRLKPDTNILRPREKPDSPSGASPCKSSETEWSAFESALGSAPATLQNFKTTLESARSLEDGTLTACFKLIEHTSSAAYKASTRGWSPAAKLEEMKDSSMRYVLLHRVCSNVKSDEQDEGSHKSSASKDNSSNGNDHDHDDAGSDGGTLAGFLSYMITMDDGHSVSYVYEVHLADDLQGMGIGCFLMSVAEAIAAALDQEMMMLTVFTSNKGAIRFYEKLGYEMWDEEPRAVKRKKLRSGIKVIPPSYVILAKKLEKQEKT